MWIRKLTLAGLLALASQPAFAVIGPWVSSDKVRARLVVAAPAAGGALDGAIEIELAPGWKTYWRSPGDAGVPPRFDFSASTNAEAQPVEFPAPERYDDGYAASNVYHDRVVLPVRFVVADDAKPVALDVKMDIGICEEICIPVNLNVQLNVPVGAGDSAATALVATARADLPGPGRPGQFEVASLKRVGGSEQKPEFEAIIASEKVDDTVLFIETPGDWYAAAPKPVAIAPGKTGFRFTVDRRTASGGIAGSKLRLTLTEGKDATSRTFTLDASHATP